MQITRTDTRTDPPVFSYIQEEDSLNPYPLYIDREDNKKPLGRGFFPFAGSAVFLLLIGAFAFLPEAIVAAVPQTRIVYDRLGMFEPPALEISDIRMTHSQKGGIDRLTVSGEIRNRASHSVRVPKLKLTLRDNQKTDIYRWTASAAKNSLEAGETSAFSAVAQNYPERAVDMAVEFLRQ